MALSDTRSSKACSVPVSGTFFSSSFFILFSNWFMMSVWYADRLSICSISMLSGTNDTADNPTLSSPRIATASGLDGMLTREISHTSKNVVYFLPLRSTIRALPNIDTPLSIPAS